ncbi:YceI family protein [Parafilimonas terrae]|jgi:polyisoprenoid-binding protein YceI|uniref:Polyisoprenoid-binding protein YceI n=1 Tax=Parafilimonas terrae TaxID=1465490 RepID=A0A1I5X0L0_9BACT|nr:YceI family protein [Parafilimonas terrae]SFQ25454.1 Polyisoprenoid-binding protein YceI [Parafilimonas terrae]
MATYKIDASHSEIGFKVKHLVISTVSGNFSKFDATMEAEKSDFTDASISFEADVDSISTKSEQRDGHLKSDDFFNAEKHPKITFKSTSIEKKDDNEYILHGDLTIRDVTKNIALKVEHGGSVLDPWGQTREGFELTGKISRKEFGLKWHALTEAGGAVVGDEVRLLINVEMVKQA